MATKQIDGYRIKMSQSIGSGTYGVVYVGEADQTKKKVAVKVLKKSSIDNDDYLKSALFQQIKIMQTLKNPNIVKFIDVMQSSSNYYIIQQLCNGDMSSLMKQGKPLPQDLCINMLTQICNGFLVLVREGIIHRDLKPDNVMIKDNILKIGDFGFAKKIPNMAFKNKTCVGTPLYMSIQVLKNQDYTSKCDIWALGMIFYQALHGRTAWKAKSQFQLVQNIVNQPLQIRRNDLHKYTISFIKGCLAVNQSDRLSWDEVFLHPIFQGFFDDKGTNKTFQNRLKQIMNDLRFYIKSNNLDLSKILVDLGYKSELEELSFEQYLRFLKKVNPGIKKQEALYIFKQTDLDNSNSISIIQIQNILKKHSISFTSSFKNIPKFVRNKKSQIQSFTLISQQSQKKIQNCFYRLYKIIKKDERVSLRKVFDDFDKKKDQTLSEKEFMYMMQKLDTNIAQDQVIQAFNLIDQDGSKTIQFDQLNNYYCKINGIPKQKNQSHQPMDIQPNQSQKQIKSQRNFKVQHKHTYPPNSPQNQSPGHQMIAQMKQHPMMHPMMQHPMMQPMMHPNMQMLNQSMDYGRVGQIGQVGQVGFYPNQNMGQHFMSQQQVQQQSQQVQPQGIFGNFIMNQLAQNVQQHNSQGYIPQPPYKGGW